MTAHCPEPVLRRLAWTVHGELGVQQQLRRAVRRGDGAGQVVDTFDSGLVRSATVDAVRDALRRYQVPFVAVPGLHGTVATIAVSTVDRRRAWMALQAGLTGPGWAARVHTQALSRPTPISALRPRRVDRATGLVVFRTCTTAAGQVLSTSSLGTGIDFWEPVVSADVPRADSGYHQLGTLVAPRPNGVVAYLTAAAWATAIAAPNNWIVAAPLPSLLELREPVDIVYTWVDGDDPEWQARKAAFSTQPAFGELNDTAVHDSRFWSRDELKYSLRSVQMYAPWVRRIFIVTDGQVPAWLDTSNPRITVVDHKEIFSEPAVLPVFNSHAIESQLHHIPGLAEHYIYLNDDFFFGRPVTPEQFFFGNGTAKFFLSLATLDLDQASRRDLPVLSAAKTKSRADRTRIRGDRDAEVPAHPQPQLRSLLEDMEYRHRRSSPPSRDRGSGTRTTTPYRRRWCTTTVSRKAGRFPARSRTATRTSASRTPRGGSTACCAAATPTSSASTTTTAIRTPSPTSTRCWANSSSAITRWPASSRFGDRHGRLRRRRSRRRAQDRDVIPAGLSRSECECAAARRVRLSHPYRDESLPRLGQRSVEATRGLVRRLLQLSADRSLRGVFGSNENLVGRPFASSGRRIYPDGPDNFRLLAALLAPYRPVVFLSLRPQDEFLESYYLQTVHQGSTSTFADWLAGLDLAALSWRPLVAAARDCFGYEAVRVVDFRGIRSSQPAYLASFLSSLVPCSPGDIDNEVVHNPSVSEKGLRLALVANPYLRGPHERRAMRKFLQRRFSNVGQPRPVLLTTAQRASLVDRYGDEYEDIVTSARRPDTPVIGGPDT